MAVIYSDEQAMRSAAGSVEVAAAAAAHQVHLKPTQLGSENFLKHTHFLLLLRHLLLLLLALPPLLANTLGRGCHLPF